MTGRTRLALVAVLAVIVLGGAGVATWALIRSAPATTTQDAAPSDASTPSDPRLRVDAAQAAAVTADLPVHRAAALDPLLIDDPQAVPVYPTGTTIVLDQASWVSVGESASAYATVTPPGQRVLVHFARLNDEWRITQIETQP